MISICKLTHDQIKKLSKEMVILIDTREKVNDHILNYFNKKNIAYRQQALEFGDYSFMLPKVDGLLCNELYFHKEIVIERKIMKHNYNTQLKPTSYMASLKSFEQRYDLKMQFIDPQYSGYNIYSTFYYYMRNKLH